jgi:NAD(P)-dependent dehydrogenase (short-subunit alcohol dehydrogenase family)
MSYVDLTGKIILVTGASSGIGRDVAKSIARRGATVVLTGRSSERLEQTRADMQGEHVCVPADLLDRDQATHLAKTLPVIDGVVHCAGISKPVPLRLAPNDVIEETFRANLHSTVYLLRELLKSNKVKVGGSIVLISSIAAVTGTQGTALYAMSKAALMGGVRALAIELARKKMRINCVTPAIVKTEIFTSLQDEWLAEQAKRYPLGLGEPADVSNAIMFLLSDAAAYMTGTEIVMDGGCTSIE